MRKLLLLAALALAALTMRAQTPADSLAVMLRRLEQTNIEVTNINNNLRLHSQLALCSFAMMGASAFSFYRMSVADHPGNYHDTDWPKVWKTVGITAGVVGCVGFVFSYFPTLEGRVKFDGKRLYLIL